MKVVNDRMIIALIIALGIWGIVVTIGVYFFGRRSAQLECCKECYTQLSSYATALQLYERMLQQPQSLTQRMEFEIKGFARD
jgi:hypothetical protein